MTTTQHQTSEDGIRLEIAAMHGDIEEIRRIFSANPRCVNNRGNWKWTPLMRASDKGQNEAVNVLLNECKAGIHLRSKDGHTALHIAAAKGNRRVVKDLIHGGADVDVVDSELRTPLMMACCNGHAETAKELISHRAELDRLSKDKRSAKDMARKHKTIYDLLHILETAPPAKRAEYNCGCLKVQQQYKELQSDVAELTKTVESLPVRDDYTKLQKQVDKLAGDIQNSKGNDEYKNIQSKLDNMAKKIENLRSQQGAAGGVPNNDQRNEQLKTNQAWALTEVDDNAEEYGAGAAASRKTSMNSSGDMSDIHHKVFSRLATGIGINFKQIGLELGMEWHKLKIYDNNTNKVDATIEMLVDWQASLPENTLKAKKVELLCEALTAVKRVDLIKELKSLIRN